MKKSYIYPTSNYRHLFGNGIYPIYITSISDTISARKSVAQYHNDIRMAIYHGFGDKEGKYLSNIG